MHLVKFLEAYLLHHDVRGIVCKFKNIFCAWNILKVRASFYFWKYKWNTRLCSEMSTFTRPLLDMRAQSHNLRPWIWKSLTNFHCYFSSYYTVIMKRQPQYQHQNRYDTSLFTLLGEWFWSLTGRSETEACQLWLFIDPPISNGDHYYYH